MLKGKDLVANSQNKPFEIKFWYNNLWHFWRFGGHLGNYSIKITTKHKISYIIRFLDFTKVRINTNCAIVLYLEQKLWRIIDLFLYGGHIGGHLGFWKRQAGGEWPSGLNFNETLRTIEKCKEMISKRRIKLLLMGSCHWTTSF